LHWLDPGALADLHRTVATRLRPGGVFVDADNRDLDGPLAAGLGRYVREARARRAGVLGNEDWRSWWAAALTDPGLAPLADARSAASVAHSGENGLTLGRQAAMLRDAGFAEVTTVWQSGDDLVLVGVR
jgi:hypothetical protein